MEKQNKEKQSKCVLCGEKFEGFGNNAEPVAKGRCCDECNMIKVIPQRMYEIYCVEKKCQKKKTI